MLRKPLSQSTISTQLTLSSLILPSRICTRNNATPLRALSLSARLHAKNQPLPPRPVIDEKDITEVFLRGSGPGGQKINKTSSAVQLKHLPTGLVVKHQGTRSRSQNRKIARRMLAERIEEMELGSASRTAIKRERASKKKASAAKKKRRKYRKLGEEGESEVWVEEEEEEGEGEREGVEGVSERTAEGEGGSKNGNGNSASRTPNNTTNTTTPAPSTPHFTPAETLQFHDLQRRLRHSGNTHHTPADIAAMIRPDGAAKPKPRPGTWNQDAWPQLSRDGRGESDAWHDWSRRGDWWTRLNIYFIISTLLLDTTSTISFRAAREKWRGWR